MTGSFLTLFSFSFLLHPLADDLVHELPVRAAAKPLHRLPHERGDRALASGCDEVATLRDDLVDDPLDLLAGGAFEPEPLRRIRGATAGPRHLPKDLGGRLLGQNPPRLRIHPRFPREGAAVHARAVRPRVSRLLRDPREGGPHPREHLLERAAGPGLIPRDEDERVMA